MHILAYFASSLKTMRSIFARLDEKLNWLRKFYENFRRKVNRKNDFSIISRKVVARNRALENNTRFLQRFFPDFGGGGRSCVPPFQAPMLITCKKLHFQKFPWLFWIFWCFFSYIHVAFASLFYTSISLQASITGAPMIESVRTQ